MYINVTETMYINVTETMFKDEFRRMGRLENFSHEGLRALYDYFTQMENDLGEPIELDVIAICCDFNEEPITDVLENYNLNRLDELHDNTCVIAHFRDSVVYQIY